MSVELVKPQVIDGIEFYVSNDAEQVGVSVTGVATLSGVSHQAMSNLIATKSRLEALGLNDSNVFHSQLTSENGRATIITSEAAVKIIEYYAFESRNPSKTAQFSFRKFASMGFDSWVKSITGHAQSQDTQSILTAIQEVLTNQAEMKQEIQELKIEVKEYRDIRGVTTVVYANLDQMLNSLPNSRKALPSSELTTCKEWLSDKGITLDLPRLSSFGRQVADTYKSMTGCKPPNKNTLVNGKWVNIGKGYKQEHFTMIDTVWRQFNQ